MILTMNVACSSNDVLVQRFEPLSDFNRKKNSDEIQLPLLAALTK